MYVDNETLSICRFFQYHLPLNTKNLWQWWMKVIWERRGKYKHQSEIFTKKNVQVRSGYVKINKLIRCWPIPYKLFAGMRLLSSSNQDIFPPLSRLNIVALGMPVIKIADRLYLLAFINSARNVLWNKSFFPPPRHLTFTRWVRCSVSDGIGIS